MNFEEKRNKLILEQQEERARVAREQEKEQLANNRWLNLLEIVKNISLKEVVFPKIQEIFGRVEVEFPETQRVEGKVEAEVSNFPPFPPFPPVQKIVGDVKAFITNLPKKLLVSVDNFPKIFRTEITNEVLKTKIVNDRLLVEIDRRFVEELKKGLNARKEVKKETGGAKDITNKELAETIVKALNKIRQIVHIPQPPPERIIIRDVSDSNLTAPVTEDGLKVDSTIKELPLPEGAATEETQTGIIEAIESIPAPQTDALTNEELRDTPVEVDTGLTQPTTPSDIQPVGVQGLVERIVFNTLKRLNVDSAGRLRVAAETVANMTTLTTLTNLTNWGLTTATAKSQWDSNLQYQSGFRRNLVVS